MEGVGGLPFKGPDGQTQFPDYSRFFPDDGTTPVGTPTTLKGAKDTQTTADGSGGVTGTGQTGGANQVAGAPTLTVPHFHHSHNATQATTVNQSVVDGPAGPSFTPPGTVAQVASNFANFGAEFAALTKHIEDSMPNGPEKQTMKDLRLAVALALEDLQRAIQDASVTTSEQSTKISQGQMEATEHKLQAQQAMWKQINDQLAAAEQKKESKAGKIGKIFGAIFEAIFIAIVAPLLMIVPGLGWAALAFLVVHLVDSCQKISGKETGTAMSQMMGALDKASDAIEKSIYTSTHPCPAEGSPERAAWDAGLQRAEERGHIVTAVFTVVLMAIACPQALLFDAGAFTDFLAASPMMSDAYALRHGGNIDPTEVAKENMILSITLTCVCMVAGIVASVVVPGAMAGEAAEIGEMTNQIKSIADLIIDSAEIESKIAQTLVRIVANPQLYINATQTTLNTIGGLNELAYDKIMATVTQMQGELDSGAEQSDADIAVLKKIIQKLLDSLTGMSDQIQSIGNQLSKSTYNWTQTVMQMG